MIADEASLKTDDFTVVSHQNGMCKHKHNGSSLYKHTVLSLMSNICNVTKLP